MLLLHRFPRLVLAITVAAGTVYCSGGDDITVPTGPGSLQITTATSGVDHDADGYSVQLDGGTPQSIGVEATLTTDDVAPGSHAVGLLGLADNCMMSGDNPRTVIVSSGETTRIDFAVVCTATTGALTVSASTSGPSPDVDGYTLVIDGANRGPLAANATATISALGAGTHLVGLSGLAANCTVSGENPRTVSVSTGQTATVGFAVACGATTGTLRVTAATSGPSPDADGYTLFIDEVDSGPLGSNATTTINALAAGTHLVALTGLAANCTVSGENPLSVSVVAGQTATVSFAVACGATTGTLRVTATTSGPSPDTDGYAVSLDGADRGSLTTNGAITISALAPGTHMVGLSGLAANCQIQGDNVRPVTITAGAQATVAYNIACVAPPAGAGTLRLTASTTGPDSDADGYTFKVDAGEAQPIGVNAEATLTNLAVGSHTVELAGIAGNCALQGANPRSVTITSGATTNVNFTVTCAAATGTLRITVTTSGSSIDADGYSIRLDDADPGLPIDVDGTVIATRVGAGTHTAELVGVAGNCAVEGANPKPVTVIVGATAELNFVVICAATTGSIRVTVTTSGSSIDADGYVARLDNADPGLPISSNGSETFTGVAAGAHTIQLAGAAGNCAIEGTNPRSVAVTAGSTTDLNFTVACVATSGTIRVSATTSGSPVDPDGYTVKLDNTDPGLPIAANASVSFNGISAGTHAVSLTGLAPNCNVDGEASASVEVTAGETVEVVFAVVCTPPTVTNRLEKVSGDPQTGPAGTTLSSPLVVSVTDGSGDGVPGVAITWSVTGGGSVSATTTTTAADGQASVTRTLGAGAGEQKTMATADGLTGSPATFTHTATGPNTTGMGRWDPLFTMPVVGVHTHLLMTGKVLIWGDRGDAQLWSPGGGFTAVPKTYRIYCSAHTFLPDGRLLVVGGTSAGTLGLRQAAIFNPSSGSWSTAASMAQGRYYATTTTLPSGDVLAVSGHDTTKAVVTIPEVRSGDAWRRLTSAPLSIPDPYYPAMFVAPNGKVFMAGFPQMTQYLDVSGSGAWTPVGNRVVADRTLGSAVMYAPGKILYAGGGDPPTRSAEVIDLNQASPSWRSVAGMAFARRQMNATLLADGSVLVTGGTSAPGFNNQSGSVRAAELWNPETESWRTLAAESRQRTYHGTSLLLPTGQVLSSGSGEGGGIPFEQSDFTSQIFNPPYLFNRDGSPAPRPRITSAPARLSYGQSFSVQSPDAATVARGTLIRLSSVTHAFNMSQLIYRLTFSAAGSTTLDATAPASGNLAPPGPYMLFLINASGTPSEARMVMVGP